MQPSMTVTDKKWVLVLPNNEGEQSNLHDNYVPDWTFVSFCPLLSTGLSELC
jgi:hypothetical protein